MIDLTALCERIDMLGLCPDVKPAGRDKYRGRCPLCSGSGFALAMHRKGYLAFNCFSCHAKGSPLDLYALSRGISIGQAIARLADGSVPTVTPEERVGRMADAARASEGYAVLACDNPKCGRTKEVKTELDAVIMMSGGSNWEVAPDGVGALCWACA